MPEYFILKKKKKHINNNNQERSIAYVSWKAEGYSYQKHQLDISR